MRHCKKIFAIWIILIFVLPLLPSKSIGGDAVLRWDQEMANTDGTQLTDLGGFKVYNGVISVSYTSIQDVGMATQTSDPCPPASITYGYQCYTYTYTVSGLPDGSIYYFALTAYDIAGNESGYSNEVYKNISVTALGAPVGLQLAGSGKIVITWNSVSTANGYQISVRSGTGIYNAVIDAGTAITYTLYRLLPDTYYVKVRAYKATEFSVYSSEASVVLYADSTLPADVSNFTATAYGTGVRLSWTNPPDPDFYGLTIDYATSTPAVWTNIASPVGRPSETQSYDHKDLNAGNYQYRIRTKDTSGKITSTEYAYIELQQTPVVVAHNDVVQNEPTQSLEPPKKKEKKSSGFGCGTTTGGNKPPDNGIDGGVIMLAGILLFWSLQSKSFNRVYRKERKMKLITLLIAILLLFADNAIAASIDLVWEQGLKDERGLLLVDYKIEHVIYVDSNRYYAGQVGSINETCVMTEQPCEMRKITVYGLKKGDHQFFVTSLGDSGESKPSEAITKEVLNEDKVNLKADIMSDQIHLSWTNPSDTMQVEIIRISADEITKNTDYSAFEMKGSASQQQHYSMTPIKINRRHDIKVLFKNTELETIGIAFIRIPGK